MSAKPKAKPASDAETPDDLPEGWEIGTVREIFASFGGGTPNRGTSAYWGGSIPWLSSGDIKEYRIRSASETITKAGLENSSANMCRTGSVVVVVRSGILAHTLPVAVLECGAAINQDIKCFDSQNDDLNAWLALALRSSAKDILALNREGTTVQSVKYDTLKDFSLRIPPRVEQYRIVTKIEELLENVNASRERLAKVPKILKAFRQSVLAAACSGSLTEEWRNKQPGSKTGNELLAELLDERRRQWIRHQGTRNYRDPVGIASEELEDIPDTWVWASVDSLSSKVVDGVHKTPEYVVSGVPFVTVRNLTAGPGIDFESLHYVTNSDHRQFIQRANPERGDLLVSKDGTLGVVRAIRTDKVFSIFVSVALIKLVSVSLTDYLELALSSPSVQAQMVGTGSGLQHIHLRDLRADGVPLPPLEEQKEIVRRVEILFKLADKIEKRVEAATKRADKLTQSILAKAFRGELVPTEAELARKEGRDYEPASALLERVKSKRDRAKTVLPANSRCGPKRRSARARKN